MNNFTQRLITGAVYVGVTIFCCLHSLTSAFVFLAVIAILGIWELQGLLQDRVGSLQKVLITFIGLLVFTGTFVFSIGPWENELILAVIIAGILLAFVAITLDRKADFLISVRSFLMSLIYISSSLSFFLKSATLDVAGTSTQAFPFVHFEGIQMLVVFILIWSSDTFAYLVGRWLGKHKLAPSISPKKTVEGFVGGVVCTIGIALVLSHFFPFMGIWEYAGLGLICSLFGTLGDLFESRIKRSLGVKDSGSILPGHGGILDRFDSLLFAGPAYYAYLLVLFS